MRTQVDVSTPKNLYKNGRRLAIVIHVSIDWSGENRMRRKTKEANEK